MNTKEKKQMKAIKEMVMEMSPILNLMKELADERVKLMEILDRIEPFVEPLEELYDKMEDAYESKSEKWKETENGSLAYERLDAITRIKDNLTDCMYYVEILID